jgi:hypothetical protein
VEKLKNAKTLDISAKSMDCQLQSMSQTARENGGISTPLVINDGSLMRQSPQLLIGGDPTDVDDTDPDVIPNQYGEYSQALRNEILIWSLHAKLIYFDSLTHTITIIVITKHAIEEQFV